MLKTAMSAFLAATSLGIAAADFPKPLGAITQTRYTLLFGGMERQLLAAQSRHDTAELERILAPGFEVRRSNGQVITRKDWLQAQANAVSTDSTPSKLIVDEVGEYAVASFFLGKSGDSAGVFIVDVWVPDGQTWRLRARFESPLA